VDGLGAGMDVKLEDRSTNGTYLNDELIGKGKSRILRVRSCPRFAGRVREHCLKAV
jgi:pSer/pThr/pTyr-binding forkhead associated (FHA) protein